VLADEWMPEDRAGLEENRVFNAAFELAEAARSLDRTAGIPNSSGATAAVLGAGCEALHSQADAIERIRSIARHELQTAATTDSAKADVDELYELLGSTKRNLSAMATQLDRARELTARILEDVPPDR
jgi:hypothetical protein